MIFTRKFLVLASMAAIVTTAVAFTAPAPPDDNGFANLKILPKDITHEKLNKIMRSFNNALGVKCSFCHAQSKDTSVHHPDFASDDKPEKSIARSMMKMTVKINKKFFEAKHAAIGDSTLTVTCVTCHHGTAHPEEPAQQPEHRQDHPQGTAPGGGSH